MPYAEIGSMRETGVVVFELIKANYFNLRGGKIFLMSLWVWLLQPTMNPQPIWTTGTSPSQNRDEERDRPRIIQV